MTIEQDFIPFAAGVDANVLSQSAYAALTTLTQNGFQAGIAPSIQLNKVWRQSSIMAAVLAQFIVARTGQTAIDDGTTATLLANLELSAAALNGDSTQTFSVAPATAPQHAMQLQQATGRLLNVQTFTTSGTYTPTAGATSAIVEVQGAGGGSGSTVNPTTGSTYSALSGPGGAGAYAKVLIPSGSLSSRTITIGAGGAGAAAGGTAGTAGGASSFGSLVSCPGGVAGAAGAGAAGSGFQSSTGPTSTPTVTSPAVSIVSLAGAGSCYGIQQGPNSGAAGTGGNSVLGFGGLGGQGIAANSPGQSGVGYGSGAGGSYSTYSGGAAAGAAGKLGIVIVSEYA